MFAGCLVGGVVLGSRRGFGAGICAGGIGVMMEERCAGEKEDSAIRSCAKGWRNGEEGG